MYRYPRTAFAILLFLYLCIASSCRENKVTDPIISKPAEQVVYSPVATPEEQKTLHVDTVYEYKFRTGESGHYKYNYDVIGIDGQGNSVFGNVSMQGKYGAGIIHTEDREEIEVSLEWIGYGELRAEDEEGNTWKLQVE